MAGSYCRGQERGGFDGRCTDGNCTDIQGTFVPRGRRFTDFATSETILNVSAGDTEGQIPAQL
jgi:hypothetical protein